MDKYAKLVNVLKEAVTKPQYVPVLMGEVKEVTGESCTVLIDDLELTEVRLKATINESTNKILISPKLGSMVLIGSLTGDLKDLAVLRMDELEKIEYEQDGLKIAIDSTDKKIAIENEDISLLGLMEELISLLKAFKVFTPSGPSGAPLPFTLSKLDQFEKHVKQLLK